MDKSSIQEKKIRVAFLDPKGSPAADSTIATPNKSTALKREGVCSFMQRYNAHLLTHHVERCDT
jgi:hypothetical protein